MVKSQSRRDTEPGKCNKGPADADSSWDQELVAQTHDGKCGEQLPINP